MTKICNALLPTATTLKRWKWQHHDNCILCNSKETEAHMIQCSDNSRKQWRLKYITALRNKLESTETDGSLTMHLCLILTQWMDTGTVVAVNFPEQFHRAIYSQYSI